MPSKQLIIAITGPKGSGKGTAAKYLAEKYGAHVLRFSFFIEELLESLKLSKKDRDIQINFMDTLRRLLGVDILAHAIIKKISTMKAKMIVIDGVRFIQELQYLRKNLKNLTLIAIKADPKTRFFRTKKRGEKVKESTFTYTQFLAEHKRSTEKPIPKVMRQADFTVNNSKDLPYLQGQLDTIIKKLLS